MSVNIKQEAEGREADWGVLLNFPRVGGMGHGDQRRDVLGSRVGQRESVDEIIRW